ncbi:MAG: hypothetical protein NVSMB48_27300 [Marmoricola sp.]
MPVIGSEEVPAAELLQSIGNGDLTALVRAVLDTIVRVTGMESSYLTFIDWEAGTQEIRFLASAGELDVEEGVVVPWQDTLCRRAMVSGIHQTSDVDDTFGAENAGHDLGIVTYVSVPVVTHDRSIYGTLCAASAVSRPVDAAVMDLLRLFAQMLGSQVDNERSLALERQRTEQTEQRWRSRLMLLAESEHRVKTPLTVIRGVATTLDEYWDRFGDEQRREMLTTVRRQSVDLLDCVEVLLAQAREEMNELTVSQTALYVGPVMEQVAADYGAATSDHEIGFSGDAPVVARVDVISLRQLLGHLIDNAMKYTPRGGRIALAARTDGERAIITVADDGPGLPDGFDPFAPFLRGADSERQATGTGLGLHVVRTIATRLGGTVSAHNSASGGAVFVIELPAA